MKVLSLFDGISCGMVALRRLGIDVEKYVAYEIDENAIYISKHNYPEIEHKGDVFKAVYQEGEFDLLIGGSPCTYWSIAGARSNGHREVISSGLGWDLFSQYVRALNEAKPRYFLYENNESMSDGIKSEITKYLGVEPVMIDSADYSAQHRKRYYWTNIPVDLTEHISSSKVIKDIIYDNTYKVKTFDKYKDTMKISNDGKAVKWDSSGKGYYSQQNRARSPEIKMNTLPTWHDVNNIWLGGTLYRQIHPVEAERLQTLPDNYTNCLKSDGLRIKAVGNGWTVDVIVDLLKGLTVKENKC